MGATDTSLPEMLAAVVTVVMGDVAATVTVVAMSEKAGASSWGTRREVAEGSPSLGLRAEEGGVGGGCSSRKKCWSPLKSLVRSDSWKSRPFRWGCRAGSFSGDIVVAT